jgi:4-amino-4-deoxy-L-arabinose transferase-like glycosyltransferase
MTTLPPIAIGSPSRWLAPLGLAVLVVGLFFIRLGEDVPLRSHEALLAETARNMVLERPVQLADGSRPSPWLVPNFNDTPRLRKTPLPYWAVAGLASLAGGVDEWTARLPSALAALGTVLVVMALMRRQSDRPTARLAGAALATSGLFLVMARTAQADMMLAFFSSAAVAALWMAVETHGRRRFGWLVLAGAAAALAMLAKGPVPAVVLPAPLAVAAGVMIARLVRLRESPQARRAQWAWTLGGAAAGAVLFAAIALPWVAYLYLRVPEALAIMKAESVDRSTGDFGHQEPFYFYLVRLPLLAGPWTVFLIHGIVLAAKRARREAAARPWLGFLGAWLLGPLVAFSAAAGKQDHYILPVFPACAVLAAMSLRHFLAPATPQAEKAGIRIMQAHGGILMALGAAGFLAMGYLVMQPSLLPPAPHGFQAVAPAVAEKGLLAPVAYLLIICLVGGAAAAVLAVPQGLHRSLVALVATVAAAFLLAWVTVIGPLDRATTAAEFGRQVRREAPPDAPLFSFTGANNTVIFYAGRPIPILPTPDRVRQELARGRPFYLICYERNLEALGLAAGLTPVVHRTNPLRPSEGFWLFRGGPPALSLGGPGAVGGGPPALSLGGPGAVGGCPVPFLPHPAPVRRRPWRAVAWPCQQRQAEHGFRIVPEVTAYRPTKFLPAEIPLTGHADSATM